MIVIKHRNQNNRRYYHAECACGCVFEFDDSEVSFQIYCPECDSQIPFISKCVKEISKEQFLDNRNKCYLNNTKSNTYQKRLALHQMCQSHSCDGCPIKKQNYPIKCGYSFGSYFTRVENDNWLFPDDIIEVIYDRFKEYCKDNEIV